MGLQRQEDLVSNLFEFENAEGQAESIRSLISHPAWTGFILVELDRARDVAIGMLLNPSDARQTQMSDDYLRAHVLAIDTIKELGKSQVDEYDKEQADLQAESEYRNGLEERAKSGHFAPLDR